MAIKNKEKLLKLIASDCEIQHKYINTKGQTCVLGCLGRAAGVPDEVLRRANNRHISQHEVDKEYNEDNVEAQKVKIRAVKQISSAIENEFGLSLSQQSFLQSVNDQATDVKMRRNKVGQTVEVWD